MEERLVFFFESVGIDAGNPFERPKVAHRFGSAKPDIAEPSAPEEAAELVAVELAACGQCLWAS
jgi:hypothetical protein